jgi:hypothetical protein
MEPSKSLQDQLQSHFTSPEHKFQNQTTILLPNPDKNGCAPHKRTNQDSDPSASHPGNKQTYKSIEARQTRTMFHLRAIEPSCPVSRPGPLERCDRTGGDATRPAKAAPTGDLLPSATGRPPVASRRRDPPEHREGRRRRCGERERRWGVDGGRRDRGTRREERTGASARREKGKGRLEGEPGRQAVARPNERLVSRTAMIDEIGESSRCGARGGTAPTCGCDGVVPAVTSPHLTRRGRVRHFQSRKPRAGERKSGKVARCGPCGRGTNKGGRRRRGIGKGKGGGMGEPAVMIGERVICDLGRGKWSLQLIRKNRTMRGQRGSSGVDERRGHPVDSYAARRL